MVTEPLDSAASAKVDGRRLRAERSRQRMIEAAAKLIEEGDPNPTAERIAARAGLSVRLVYEHFKDLETLTFAVAAYQGTRIAELMLPVNAALPFSQRIAALVRQRDRLYAVIAPFRRVAQIREPTMATVAAMLRELRRAKREQAVALFAEELARLKPLARRRATAAVGHLVSFAAWESLHSHQGLSRQEIRAVVRRSLARILGARSK